jgi:hemolysin III
LTDKPRFAVNKDPWSWITHFAGMLASIAGCLYLVLWSAEDPTKATAMAIYGGSLVLLFAASTAYHFFDLGHERNELLRRVDHLGIFLLIAGSYVPALVHLLDGTWRIATLATVATLCLIGAIAKMAWLDAPVWLSTAVYLAIGWFGVIPAFKMVPLLDWGSIACLGLGGLAYTLGAVVFVRERPDPWPDVFGHHEVWHLFVLAGAAGHFAFAVRMLEQPIPAF